MRVRVEVSVPDTDIGLDARTLAHSIAGSMSTYWADQLRSGQQAAGGPMPTNAKGQPLGNGGGPIADQWQTDEPTGTELRAESASAPYQEGRYQFAVRSLQRRTDIVSVEGQAAARLEAAVDAALGSTSTRTPSRI